MEERLGRPINLARNGLLSLGLDSPLVAEVSNSTVVCMYSVGKTVNERCDGLHLRLVELSYEGFRQFGEYTNFVLASPEAAYWLEARVKSPRVEKRGPHVWLAGTINFRWYLYVTNLLKAGWLVCGRQDDGEVKERPLFRIFLRNCSVR